jgi:hypothetical protein
MYTFYTHGGKWDIQQNMAETRTQRIMYLVPRSEGKNHGDGTSNTLKQKRLARESVSRQIP